MTNLQNSAAVKRELDRLTAEFLCAVSFEPGETPAYENLHMLFIENGLLIKNIGTIPEVSSISQFMKGVLFEARGMISTQFILTPAGWKMSSMAWDDERPGLSIPDHREPTEIGSS